VMKLRKKIKSILLLFFTSRKSSNFDLEDTKRVLFLRYDRIGDMIITTPVFRSLKFYNKNISISVLASSVNKDVISNSPYVDEIFLNHKNNFIKDLPTLWKLRKLKFDVVVEFDHSVVPHAIIRNLIIKPKKIISIEKNGRYGINGKSLNLYDFYTPRPRDMNYRDICLKTLEPLGVRKFSRKYDLFITNSHKEKADIFLQKFEGKFLIAVNLFGAVKGKFIDISSFLEFQKVLNEKFKDLIFILLFQPNKYRSTLTYKNQSSENVFLSYETKSILDVAALIRKVDIVITPDTSIAHIASAFNKPIITIHENNYKSYSLFKPTSEISSVIYSPRSDSLEGFDVKKLIKYTEQMINNTTK